MSLVQVVLIFRVDSEFATRFDVSHHGAENEGNDDFLTLLIVEFFYVKYYKLTKSVDWMNF